VLALIGAAMAGLLFKTWQAPTPRLAAAAA
jgi:hypothetical protein